MRDFFRMMKKWDLIMIILLILFSFLPFSIFSYQQANKMEASSRYIAVITVNKEIVKEIELSSHTGTQIFEIADHDSDVNVIEVKNDHIRIKSANCSDQICVRTRAISKPGQTIVCLPHKLVIEIKAIDPQHEPSEEMIISS
ncbi:NusG domain II-containing protein [Bacillus sp. FJAT-49711]|uniref:NusG domain II-containing protein n=1 Tax=Bacillus sp. FJAT-49711 TaxID=2833585 RepID=UPI001BC96D8F|nr:NusG domain II-containing protein [Bacillus sp. FJAT-49711]MBS4217417.1 NusG domain II-containing protein [Bacillus sp. FJAT-49711]